MFYNLKFFSRQAVTKSAFKAAEQIHLADTLGQLNINMDKSAALGVRLHCCADLVVFWVAFE